MTRLCSPWQSFKPYNHSMNKLPDIMQFDVSGLQDLMLTLGEKKYRGLQLAEWLYLRRAPSFEAMGNLPKNLRKALADRFSLAQPRVVQQLTAPDTTTRYLLEFGDGVKTEAVAIPSQKRLTVCFSTQAGCALACIFCATGSLGLTRSLLPGEMLAQIALVAGDFPDTRVSNVVAMGQGEPFANYEASLAALRMINDPRLFGVGARHITVSTSGLIRQIKRFSHEPEQFTLAVSLHSAVQRTRNRIMPGLETQTLTDLKRALVDYMSVTSRRPSLEYALIEGVNDDEKELASLLAFCEVPAPGFHVNLIPFNAVDELLEGMPLLRGSSPAAFKHFEDKLSAAGISVSRRASKGAEIAAACGQLACKV